jgi:L-threonylcarbamoyladenylate synthase
LSGVLIRLFGDRHYAIILVFFAPLSFFQKKVEGSFLMNDNRPGSLLIISATDDLGPAVEVIEAGGIIAFPTETSYGLGADPLNKAAVKRLFSIKARPMDKPLPLLAGDMAMVRSLTAEFTPLAERLIKKFWPGPLTIIFEASPETPEHLISQGQGLKGIGIRISPHPVCQRLLQALGRPITATSANPAAMPPALDPAEAEEYFDGSIDIIIDGGRLDGGPPSTVVDAQGERPVFLREGAVQKAAILEAAGSTG